MRKRIIAALCAAAMLPVICANAEYKEKDIKDAVNDAIEWKEANDSPFYSVGTNNSNLYVTALRRLGRSYDYASYLSGLDGISAGYGTEHKASDMQRCALAVLASGGDPRNVGGRDLIADSTYYRDAVSPIDTEGADGFSWALLALDSKDFEIPDWGIRSRNDIIVGILSHQNTNGSFDDSVYSTAAAVTALAPYYDTSGAYTVTQNQTGWVVDLSPREAVDSAIEYLSDEQLRDGDWGDLPSTAMTVIALGTMGIDADDDDRFIANKGTAIDGLMLYQEKNGGFSADLNKSDGEATSLALCALTSYLRKIQNKAALFDFNIGDTVSLDTVPADTVKPANNSSTGTVKVTARPKTTVRPSSSTKSTSKPVNTLKPTRTAAPRPTGSASPSNTPRATKRPALVGPVEMPGPMPTPELEDNSMNAGGENDKKSKSAAPVVIVIITAILALGAAAAVWYLNKTGRLQEIIAKLLKKQNKKKPKKARRLRKTEQHRKYENREKYRQHRKFERKRR